MLGFRKVFYLNRWIFFIFFLLIIYIFVFSLDYMLYIGSDIININFFINSINEIILSDFFSNYSYDHIYMTTLFSKKISIYILQNISNLDLIYKINLYNLLHENKDYILLYKIFIYK